MMARELVLPILIATCLALPARANTIRVTLRDQSGKPAAEGVVELIPPAGAALPASHLPNEAEIDQRNRTFIPLVSLIRKGGHVYFLNHDTTMHQVYSFSTIKQFQFEIDEDERSRPVVFDQAGVAAIGCNIHDRMITYVYVAASPFAAISDANGDVRFTGVPAGSYLVHVWHPRLVPGETVPSRIIRVGASAVAENYVLSLLSPPVKSHRHTGAY